MKADRICRSEGISCRVIPVPEHISSECGMCLIVGNEKRDLCIKLLKEHNIEFELYNQDIK
jgi:hypothetical protein